MSGTKRDPNLPDVPTGRELGLAGMEALGFQGLVGPAGLPADVVTRLSNDLRKALASAEVKARFGSAGSEVQPRGPAEFSAYVKAEAEKWSALIKQRRIQLD